MKRFFLSFLAICLCCVGVLAFSGCDNNPPTHSHNYTEEKAEPTYLKSDATCTAKAVYYKSCSCGEKGTETFEYGEPKNHKYVNYICERCGDKIIVSSEGLYYEKVGETYVVADMGDFNAEDLIIPDTYNGLPVVGIEKEAFRYGHLLEQVKTIKIGNNVQFIGKNAFSGINNCEYLEIGTGVKEIDEYAFYGEKIKQIVFNAIECETVDWTAFDFDGDCEKKVIFGNMVKVVPANLFSGHHITNIEIIFEENSVCEIIEEFAFAGCDIESIVLPDSLKEIGEGAFWECIELKSIKIPNNVISIGMEAFYLCSSLEEIVFSNKLQTIGANAFEKCSKITDIILFENLLTIGDEAFRDCSSIEVITIPNTVTQIGTRAFFNCIGLKEITLGEGIKTMGAEMLRDCVSLTKIYYNAIVADDIKNRFYIFEGLHENDGISFIVGSSVTRIPANLCKTGSSGYYPNITTISFNPNSSCESIGECAFESCTAIERLDIPKSLKRVEGGAFAYALVQEIHIEDISTWCCIEFENYESNPMHRGGEKLFINGVETTDLIIPDSVEVIRKYAFYKCGVKSITIGNGCKRIENEAFRACVNVEKLTFNAATCENLLEGNKAFYEFGLHGDLVVVFGKNVTNVPDYLFGAEPDVINYYNSVEVLFEKDGDNLRIGKKAFASLNSLKEITIPSRVVEIDAAAFYYTSLGKATFENTQGWKKHTTNGVETIWNLSTPEKAAEYLKASYSSKWVYNA